MSAYFQSLSSDSFSINNINKIWVDPHILKSYIKKEQNIFEKIRFSLDRYYFGAPFSIKSESVVSLAAFEIKGLCIQTAQRNEKRNIRILWETFRAERTFSMILDKTASHLVELHSCYEPDQYTVITGCYVSTIENLPKDSPLVGKRVSKGTYYKISITANPDEVMPLVWGYTRSAHFGAMRTFQSDFVRFILTRKNQFDVYLSIFPINSKV